MLQIYRNDGYQLRFPGGFGELGDGVGEKVVAAGADGGGIVAQDERGVAQEDGMLAEHDIRKGLDFIRCGAVFETAFEAPAHLVGGHEPFQDFLRVVLAPLETNLLLPRIAPFGLEPLKARGGLRRRFHQLQHLVAGRPVLPHRPGHRKRPARHPHGQPVPFSLHGAQYSPPRQRLSNKRRPAAPNVENLSIRHAPYLPSRHGVSRWEVRRIPENDPAYRLKSRFWPSPGSRLIQQVFNRFAKVIDKDKRVSGGS